MSKLLNAEEIAGLGIDGGWILGLPDFVRYGDLDSYNHVNNKVYHAWFENLRVLYIKSLGVSFDKNSQMKPVVRSANIQFNAQMLMDEEYITLCRVGKLGRTSLLIEYAVLCNGVFCVTGDTTMVMVNSDATASVLISDELRDVLITRDGATAS